MDTVIKNKVPFKIAEKWNRLKFNKTCMRFVCWKRHKVMKEIKEVLKKWLEIYYVYGLKDNNKDGNSPQIDI